MHRPVTIADLVHARAQQAPEAVALIGGASHRTWADLDACTDRVARAFRRLGIGKGDRVGILATNCIEWIEAFLGIQRVGGVAVPLNYRLAPAECGRLVDDAGVAVLLASPELSGSASFDGPTLTLRSGWEADASPNSAERPQADLEPDDLAVIVYTSGTTGLPKGVMWTHRNVFASAHNHPFPAASATGAPMLLCTPLCAGGALIMACNALVIGATLVIEHFTPERALEALVDARIEYTGLVPTMLSLMIDAAPAGWRARTLRLIYYGGAGLRPELFARAREVFGCEFQQAYGMTETCILGTRLDPADHVPERLASAGKPMPGVTIKVVGESGAPEPAGTPGEVLIQSPGNMRGYWRRPEESGRALEGGWYHTGDIGRFDSAGYLYLLDRRDDMVKSGGFNVFPGEVEGVLLAHPGVDEAAVIGIPDERWGQRVTAVVRPRPDAALSEHDLAAFCRESLAGYKIPRTIFLTEEPLPRNALGKVTRRTLRAQYGGRRAE